MSRQISTDITRNEDIPGAITATMIMEEMEKRGREVGTISQVKTPREKTAMGIGTAAIMAEEDIIGARSPILMRRARRKLRRGRRGTIRRDGTRAAAAVTTENTTIIESTTHIINRSVCPPLLRHIKAARHRWMEAIAIHGTYSSKARARPQFLKPLSGVGKQVTRATQDKQGPAGCWTRIERDRLTIPEASFGTREQKDTAAARDSRIVARGTTTQRRLRGA